MRNKKISLTRRISRFLPLYIDLRTFKRIPQSKSKGYTLAVWNCGESGTLRKHLRDIRITIRKNGHPYFVIKRGDV